MMKVSIRKASTIFFLLSAFALGFLPVKDTDFGWHYRCGKELLKLGVPCITNRFSYFLPDYKAYNPSFLYDLVLSVGYDNFGFLGVSFLGGIIFVLIAYFFSNLLKENQFWLRMTAFYVFFFLSKSTLGLGLRSQILTILFFLIMLFLVKQVNSSLGKKSRGQIFTPQTFAPPLLMLLWVNTHIGFFIGLIILSFWFLEEAYWAYKTANQQSFKRMKMVGVILMASFLATLVNPFGLNVYREIFNHLFAPMNQMIAEWVAPPLWRKISVVTLGVVAFISILDNDSLLVLKMLLLLSFTLLALVARRNLPFFYLISLFICLQSYGKKISWSLPKNPQLILLAPVTVIAITIPQVIKSVRLDTSWSSYCNEGLTVYPCQAIKKNPHLSGNIYAAYEWGGFLIWQLPRAKVFADGRMPAWKDEQGNSPYQVYLYIIQAREGWNKKLNKLKTDYLLIQAGTFLDLLLQEKAADFGWKEQYRDKIAALYRNQIDLH